MTRFTLPIRRWLALALIATFVVPFMVTGGVVARQAWRQYGNAAAASPWWAAPSQPPHKVVIPGSHPPKIAYIAGPPRSLGQSWLLFPLVYLSTLLLTLGVIAWFLGRTVLRPLAATSRAARQIAVGNLEIELPPSRVREVAEVGAAFEAMSAALQESLRYQAALEEERRFFVGAIAHDLRTPLFSLRGYLEGMEKGIADTPRKRMRYLGGAQEKAAALERLVADLFAYTRAEYLEQTLQAERLELGPLLERVVNGLRPLAGTKDVEVVLAGSAGCIVEADGHLLERAVENVLDNALHHTPPAGGIEVTWRAEVGQVVFTVADTGSGIAAGDLPHVFDPLFRSDTSRNSQTGGVGLGLTIAQRILRAHGGDLTAANAPTGGAVFTGTLPAAAGIQPPEPVLSTPAETSSEMTRQSDSPLSVPLLRHTVRPDARSGKTG